jgi:predicted alpha/beta hydrolase family esterase
MYMNLVYYLPGANGRLETGLGQGLMQRGLSVTGRATRDAFRALSFQDQINLITQDLQAAHWLPDARVVANSYGGYLFLHAQAQMSPFPGKLLLLSPILGAFETDTPPRIFVPPRAERIMALARQQALPKPLQANVHVGSEDWQSQPEVVSEFCQLIGAQFTLAPGRGHMLGEDYVGPVLDAWLSA